MSLLRSSNVPQTPFFTGMVEAVDFSEGFILLSRDVPKMFPAKKFLSYTLNNCVAIVGNSSGPIFGNGVFLAFNHDGTNQCGRSVDGVTWELASSAYAWGSYVTAVYDDVHGYWLCSGDYSSTNTIKRSSDNGTTWENCAATGTGARYLAYDGAGRVIAAPVDTAVGPVLYSDDSGTTWASGGTVTVTRSANYTAYGLVYFKGMFISGGNAYTGSVSVSMDGGLSWSTVGGNDVAYMLTANSALICAAELYGNSPGMVISQENLPMKSAPPGGFMNPVAYAVFGGDCAFVSVNAASGQPYQGTALTYDGINYYRMDFNSDVGRISYGNNVYCTRYGAYSGLVDDLVTIQE